MNTITAPNTADEIAIWISETATICNPVARQRAREAFIDTFACILAATSEEVVQKVFEGLHRSGGGLCSVVGRTETLSAENAALVNGTAAHALDFDDNFLPAVTHASAVLVPALLALGEEVGASGDLLLDAYIVGLEIQAWLGHRMIPAHYAAGWHATSTIGAIGAAAACVRLLTLDTETARSALSMATSMACGSKIQFGSMTKPLHAGLAARAGITASRLAAAGVQAHPDPFEGPWGFLSLHHAPARPGNRRNASLAIIDHGLARKRWPCCASAHRTLDAIHQLMRENDLTAEDIARIETRIPDSNARNLRFDSPTTVNEARFSMTYTAAALAVGGTLGLEDFTEEALHRPDVRAFMPRITMLEAGPESDRGEGIWDMPAMTTIATCDGRVLVREILQPVGTIHAPLQEEDLEQKFRSCASRSLPPQQSEGLLAILRGIEGHNVRQIASYLRSLSV
ncbi:MmgE/PrpD family protein [Sneathiella chinensis]|nr:MmgE/PrpD family protein [Sneathiella chinensis]